ncbi:protein FAM204A [Hoplias malabaricus]|uniref:protein FAM204A n=1 Tax=Hoplias malabaricus TaxID=27720 RepID=UPI003462C633
MYSGLLPKGLSEADLSSGESEVEEDSPGTRETQERRLSHTASATTELESASVRPQRLCSSQTEPNELSPEDCLPGVPPELWQKFKELQKEKEVQKVNEPHRKKRRKTHHRKDKSQEPAGDPEEKSECREEHKKHWEELMQYFGINDRFQPPACSRPPLKSGLEKSMESAIAEGDYTKAEELSDRLATRELAVKIAQAAECRDFTQTRKEEEASRDARKRRKQVAWGFEAKKRWETKSNMGYM